MAGEEIVFIILFGFIGASLEYIDAVMMTGIQPNYALALSPVTGIVFVELLH